MRILRIRRIYAEKSAFLSAISALSALKKNKTIMQDNDLDTLLRDWANEQLPVYDTREKILRSVRVRRPKQRFYLRRIAAALAGFAVVAATFLFMITPPPLPPVKFVEVTTPQKNDDPIRISLIVLKKLPDSDTAVEYLEDTIFEAEGKTLHELSLGEHKLFLWIYPLAKTLYSLDVGIDKAAEMGIVAVPERTQALQFTSNGDRFDVFVSVLPCT
jgi:hypothetical protein